MRRLILLGLALALVLVACQNTLDIKETELDGVEGAVMINRSLLMDGETYSYSVGYANGNIRSDRVTLSWNPCTDEDFLCYKLLRDDNLRTSIIDPDITTVTDSLLSQDHVYGYRLVTCIKNGMAIEDMVELKTPQFLPPNQVNFEYLTATSLILTWNNRAESATGFEIEKYSYSTEETVILTSTIESYTDTQVVQGDLYRFRVRAVNPYEETGWSEWVYVTNSIYYSFEVDNGGFISNNPDGWQWGQDPVAGAYSGTRVWGTVLGDNYANNLYLWLRSPMVDIGDDMVLEFYQWYEIESPWDGGNVKISIDGGQSWNTIFPNGGYPLGSIIASGQPGFSGDATNWERAVFDLGGYAGQQAMFRWEFFSDSSVVRRGWYIDNVRIGPETDSGLVR